MDFIWHFWVILGTLGSILPSGKHCMNQVMSPQHLISPDTEVLWQHPVLGASASPVGQWRPPEPAGQGGGGQGPGDPGPQGPPRQGVWRSEGKTRQRDCWQKGGATEILPNTVVQADRDNLQKQITDNAANGDAASDELREMIKQEREERKDQVAALNGS